MKRRWRNIKLLMIVSCILRLRRSTQVMSLVADEPFHNQDHSINTSGPSPGTKSNIEPTSL
jgi:hypothetical protein